MDRTMEKRQRKESPENREGANEEMFQSRCYLFTKVATEEPTKVTEAYPVN